MVTSPFRAGSRLGRYEVVRLLGMGAMGRVYLARDPELDRSVALKLISTVDALVDARERLSREARTMARLNHPNVVAVYDVGSWHAHLFIAMERVEGSTLRDWLGLAPRT